MSEINFLCHLRLKKTKKLMSVVKHNVNITCFSLVKLLVSQCATRWQQSFIITFIYQLFSNSNWIDFSKNCTMFWTGAQVVHECCYGVSRATLTMRSLSSSLTPWQGKLNQELLLHIYQCLDIDCTVMVQQWKYTLLATWITNVLYLMLWGLWEASFIHKHNRSLQI